MCPLHLSTHVNRRHVVPIVSAETLTIKPSALVYRCSLAALLHADQNVSQIQSVRYIWAASNRNARIRVRAPVDVTRTVRLSTIVLFVPAELNIPEIHLCSAVLYQVNSSLVAGLQLFNKLLLSCIRYGLQFSKRIHLFFRNSKSSSRTAFESLRAITVRSVFRMQKYSRIRFLFLFARLYRYTAELSSRMCKQLRMC